MTEDRILIIGGGASGMLTALHLLRDTPDCPPITLVEGRATLGRGLAYDTPHRSHILNMRAGNMSAFADRPDHFLDWLGANGHPIARHGFVPRHLYGEYLDDLLTPARNRGEIAWENDDCIALRPTATGFSALLADGRVIDARAVVLATGHMIPREWEVPFTDPWSEPLPDVDATVLLVGTGLTMVDRVTRLLDNGHRGRMILLSRHGLLPQPHAESTATPFARADLPLGASASATSKWLRDHISWHQARGGDWRDIVDGIRPFMPDWWQAAAPDSRARFFRHARRFWDIHRHRVPAAVADRIAAARAAGQVRLIAGGLVGTDPVTIRHRDGTLETVTPAQISDCRGVLRDPVASASPLLASLLAAGIVRIDPLSIGIETSGSGRISGTDRPLFAIGPLTRPAFWEATSILDIRMQAARLARHLHASLIQSGASNSTLPARTLNASSRAVPSG